MTLIELLNVKISYDFSGDHASLQAPLPEKEAVALRRYIQQKIRTGRFPERFHGRFSELGA
ncbi:hypothetical protein [Marinobacter qingdaonensis]|uniref:Uncharacterized protein n=1 Tax=Marinobacter qingdaonensis TaxID=3108486 RepID=A0ABU5NUS0_9GAMM|nr:hypothetical protein [Marinobacter sp. ASW11-75]MEA1079512.1 hypothetical protein [Marinobacter sp. ASW11-75]